MEVFEWPFFGVVFMIPSRPKPAPIGVMGADFWRRFLVGWLYREKIFIELMTSDRKLKVSREGSK